MIDPDKFDVLYDGGYYPMIEGIYPVMSIDIDRLKIPKENIILNIKIKVSDSELCPNVYYLSPYRPEYVMIENNSSHPSIPKEYKKVLNDSIHSNWDKIVDACIHACDDSSCTQLGRLECEYYKSRVIPSSPPDYTLLPDF